MHSNTSPVTHACRSPDPVMATWALVANIATTLGVIASIIFGVRAERAAAKRSEAAAALSDENVRRAIGALEQIAAHDPAGGTISLPEKVEWSLTHQKGDTYLLQNTGNASAFGVTVSSAPDSHMVFREPEVTDLGPGEALTFVAARTMATSDSTITVTWEEEEREHSWRYPLPPRPSR